MLALTIPWFLVLLSIAAIVCLLKKKRKVSLFLIVVTLVLNLWCECIPFRLWNSSEARECIKIISFNIDGSSGDPLERAVTHHMNVR